MGLNGYIIGACGAVVLLLGVALYFAGQWGLSEHDKAVQLQFVIDIDAAVKEAVDKKQVEIDGIVLKHNTTVATMEKATKEMEIGFTKEIMSAKTDAANNSIEFGDSLIRDLIRVDCLWNSGEASTSVQGRAACSNEASLANTAGTGFQYTVFTPQFLRSWYQACDEHPSSASSSLNIEDWEAEYPAFDPTICGDTLVAYPPDAAKYISKFISNGEQYTTKLLNYAISQNKVIDALTKPKDLQNPKE